jgi:hypothetical protein
MIPQTGESVRLIGSRQSRSLIMRLNAPTQMVFWISVVLVVIAVINALTNIVPGLGAFNIWIAVIGYIVLVAGNIMKGV